MFKVWFKYMVLFSRRIKEAEFLEDQEQYTAVQARHASTRRGSFWGTKDYDKPSQDASWKEFPCEELFAQFPT